MKVYFLIFYRIQPRNGSSLFDTNLSLMDIFVDCLLIYIYINVYYIYVYHIYVYYIYIYNYTNI